jgi:hypothetical protein
MRGVKRGERPRLAVLEGSLISVFVWSMPRISIRRDVSACINDADYWDGEKETAKVRALPSE